MSNQLFLTTEEFISSLPQIELFWEEHVKTTYKSVNSSLKIGAVYCEPLKPKQQLVVIPGRGETAHKYAEFLYCMYKANIKTAVLFARGQGIADRLLRDRQKCHIISFDEETADIATLISCLGFSKYGLLAFSLGGLFALDFILGKKYCVNKPNRAALIAPFLWPANHINSALLTVIATIAGSIPVLQTSYTPYGKQYKKIPFEDNYHSHCRERYEAYHDYYNKHPELTIGSPTWGFVKETLLKQIQLNKLHTELPIPLFVQTAQCDQVVSSSATKNFFKKHQYDHFIPIVSSISGAYHDVLNEKDEVRNQSLNKAIDFLFGDKND